MATATSNVSLRLVRRVSASPGATSSARLIPSGVSSKAHERTSAIGNPTSVKTTTALVMTSGRWSAGTIVAATCITSQLDHGICDGDFVDVTPLQLGEEIAIAHLGWKRPYQEKPRCTGR